MIEKERTSKQIGNLTELQCITRFYEMGYSISIPYGDSDKYDFICIDTTWQSGYTRKSKLKYHTYSSDEIDYFCTYYNGNNYMISVDECGTEKTLRVLPSKNNQTKGVNFLEYYIDEKVCKNLQTQA